MAIDKALCIGDAMITPDKFAAACSELLNPIDVQTTMWLGDDKAELQRERVLVERGGPDAVPLPEVVARLRMDPSLLLVHYAPVSKKMMSLFPNLRLIGIARGGIENVDLEAANERNILVFNVSGRNAHAVSDFAVGLILAELRNIARSHLALFRGEWKKNFANQPHQLEGLAIGIVGLGKIGGLVARKLSGFDVTLSAYDPYASYEQFESSRARSISLQELMTTSDVVTIHARLTENTRRLIGKKEIAAMKRTSILVNTARSGLVDTEVLLDALESRQIAGAALDVFDDEPLPPSSPFLKLDNVTLTSHLAGTTVEALDRTPYLLCRNIHNLLAHRSTENLVNPQVLARLQGSLWPDPGR
jgi:D-3-phosphoglycerate dehydrogenase / 2-oxoglutarate reductase